MVLHCYMSFFMVLVQETCTFYLALSWTFAEVDSVLYTNLLILLLPGTFLCLGILDLALWLHDQMTVLLNLALAPVLFI